MPKASLLLYLQLAHLMVVAPPGVSIVAVLDDDFGAVVINNGLRVHLAGVVLVASVLGAARDRPIFEVKGTLTSYFICQLAQLMDLFPIQILEDVVKEVGFLEWVAAFLDSLPSNQILGNLGPQLIAQATRSADTTLPSPIDALVGGPRLSLFDVHVQTPGAVGHIDDGQFIIFTLIAEVDIGAGVTSDLLDLAVAAPVAVTVTVATTLRLPINVVDGDGGHSVAVGVAAFTDIEIIIGIFPGQLARSTRGTVQDKLLCGNIAMVDMVVDMMMLVLNHGLLNYRAGHGWRAFPLVVMVSGTDECQRSARSISTVVVVASPKADQATRINAGI